MAQPALSIHGQEGRGDWIRSPSFDAVFVVGVLVLSLGMGGAAAASPAIFPWVLGVDIWILACPHVSSTFTRLAFDWPSARAHWFLLLGLPPLVLAGTAGVAVLGGAGALFTTYYVWQTYHYTRQSYGVARSYRRRRAGAFQPDLVADAVVYAFPVWGLLHRAAQAQGEFYGNPLLLPRVPGSVADGAGVVVGALFVVWGLRELRALRSGSPRLGHALFVTSHVIITTVSYVIVPEVTYGWLFVNIWHNAQYLLFVWAFQASRFRDGEDPERRFLSRLSQPSQAWKFAAICLALGAGFYGLLGEVSARLSWGALPAVLICHLTVNFHHYLVDGVVWTSRAVRAGRP
jgi:hypothetical protein